MSTATSDLNTVVKAQAEEIVTGGTDIRPRLAEVVARNAGESGHPEGLINLVRAVIDGAREGLARAVPEDRDDEGGPRGRLVATPAGRVSARRDEL